MKKTIAILATGTALSFASTAGMAGDTLNSAIGGGLGGAAGAAF